MKKFHVLRLSLVSSFALFISSSHLQAQLADEPRPLAPGVLKVIPTNITPEDSFSPFLKIPGLTAEKYSTNFAAESQTLFGQTQNVVFFRDVWAYEFAMTGLRQIELEFQKADGSKVNKHFYYMVYRIRNFGNTLTYEKVKQQLSSEYIKYELRKDKIEDGKVVTGPEKFRPELFLEGWVADGKSGYQAVKYPDRYLPEVAKAIQRSEDPNRRLYNKFELEDQQIPLAANENDPGVWGVAIWEDVNPALDFISVYVHGLTNAYKINADSQGEQTLKHKTLKLNFWRVGDSVEKSEDQITYGIPFVDKPAQQIEICRRFELPGPQLHIVLTYQNIEGKIKIAEVDAEVDLDTFESPVVAQLTKGEIPASVIEALKVKQFDVPAGTKVIEVVPGQSWSFEMELNGEQRKFIILFKPQFWAKDGQGIRFLRSLDNFWLYR